MKLIGTLLLCFVCLGMVSQANAQDAVRLRVQLIAADQQGGESDARLAKLMPKLKRLPYKHFEQKGSKVVALSVGQNVKTKVGGHTMKLKLTGVQDGRARVHVNWVRGKESVVEITAVTQPDAPFVCGGPREGDLTWIAVFSVQ